jgi:PhnB protein
MARQTQDEKYDRAISRVLARPRSLLTAVEIQKRPPYPGYEVPEVSDELRELPRESFKNRLKSNLERRIIMAASTQVARGAHASATPYLSIRNASAALEFYKKAFGAIEVMRLVQPDGRIGHAEIDIEGAKIMLADEFPEMGFKSPESFGGSPVHINLSVSDVDARARRAIEAGATVVRPVEDQFYGERSGQILDPFGYTWAISTPRETLSTEEMQRRIEEMSRKEIAASAAPERKFMREGFHSITPYLVVPRVAQLIDFLKTAFGAEERFRMNRPGTEVIMHAELKIGDSMLEMADANDQFPPTPATMILHVDDVDAVYNRTIAAGALAFEPVADHELGALGRSVRDVSGNTWQISKPAPGNTIFKDYRSVTPHFNPLRAPVMIEFLQKAFGAQEVYRAQSPDGVIHYAQLRIGDSILGMGEAHGPYQPAPATLHLYVPDADAVYESALRAGATSIQPVSDQPYGDRSGGVRDPFGNRWFIATHVRDVAY